MGFENESNIPTLEDTKKFLDGYFGETVLDDPKFNDLLTNSPELRKGIKDINDLRDTDGDAFETASKFSRLLKAAGYQELPYPHPHEPNDNGSSTADYMNNPDDSTMEGSARRATE